PPRLRNAAHAERALDDRPHHRRLPGRAAGAGAHHDRELAPGRRHADAAPDGRRAGSRRRARDPASRRRRPEPHPPGKDRAGLLDHADQHRARNADDGAGARRPHIAPGGERRGRVRAHEPARHPRRHPRALRHGRPRRHGCTRAQRGATAAGLQPARRRRWSMSESIWKKDLSFRKKKIDDLPETAESLRVKELAFQQKLVEAAQAAALPVVEAPKFAVAPPVAPEAKPEKKQSIWKKEIGGGRKKAAAEPVAQEVAAPLPPAPIVAVPAPAVEIALAPEPVAVPAPAVEVALAPDPVALAAPSAPTLDVPVEGLLPSSPFASNESIWKKEISFRRKPADPQQPAVDDASGDDLPEPPVSIWKKEITFRRKGDPSEDKAKSDSIWHKDISLRRSQARSAQIRALAEEALRQVEASTPPEPWLAGPELPPEPTAEPEAAAPEQPTEPEEPKKSIWKRELGTPKASKEPKAEKPEKPKKTPKAERAPKPKTRLRDMKISLPKPAPKVHSSGGHAVKRLVGLKIGASQLAAARVSNNGAAELMQVARQPLQQGVVVGGEVRDPEALALALKQFFAKNKLP